MPPSSRQRKRFTWSMGIVKWPLLVFHLLLLNVINLPKPTQAELNSVLNIDIDFPYLRDKLTNKTIEPRDYMNFDEIYAPNNTFKLKQTAQARNYRLIKAFDYANYFKTDIWHYSSADDLRRSGEPVANVAKCGEHLSWIERQLVEKNGIALFKPGQEHVNLMTLVDSFGRPEAATYHGHGYWLGSYYECTRASVNVNKYNLEDCLNNNNSGSTNDCIAHNSAGPTDESLKFRYCIGKAHDSEWPQSDTYVPRVSYKVGLCLPETCDTLSYQQYSDKIERLMQFNLPEFTRNRISLHGLYCLPDSRSPIRRLPWSARLFLSLCFIWLATLVLATFLYSCHKRHKRDLCEILQDATATTNKRRQANNSNLQNHTTTTKTNSNLCQTVSCNNISNVHEGSTSDQQVVCSSLSTPHMMITAQATVCGLNASAETAPQDVSITRSVSSSMRSVTSRSFVTRVSSAWLAESPLAVQLFQALSIKETLREFRQPPRAFNTPGASKRLRVNLNALDAIKCLCCILVIYGHIIFIHMQHLSYIVHTIELSYEVYPRALIAFFNFVDTFFIISGMLTVYFIFKRFNAKTFSSPLVWFYVSFLRLARLSPVYVLVFWFIKTTSVYVWDGPIWDYGTDHGSIKGLCMHDKWWKSILYFGNWGTMQPLCILPAWSIIVDAQYSLFMPPIIYLIFTRRRLAYALLLIATCISTTKMTLQLANQTAVKTSDMAKIRLHVYPLISRFAAEFYNTAWNRIGPVAIGMFGGHLLYLYEIGTIKRWPRIMRGLTFKLVLALHLLIFFMPILARLTDDPTITSTSSDEHTDSTVFILSNATIKPIWSVINTIFLLRLITDLRQHSVLARLMSHNIWHCLGKLCFTSYLIHYEIILTMLKSRESFIDPNWSNALREFSAVFLISTFISFIIYITYEAPINRLISLLIIKQGTSNPKNKTKKSTNIYHNVNNKSKNDYKNCDNDDNDDGGDTTELNGVARQQTTNT